MIPLKDQEMIRQKLAEEMVFQVKIDYFSERELGLTVPGKQPCVYCKPTGEMLTEIAGLSDLISLRVHYLEDHPPEQTQFGVTEVPGIVLRRGETVVKYYGIPAGTEFPGFIECIIDLSRGETLLSEASLASLASLESDVGIKVFVTPTCPYCPGMMRLAYQLAMASPKVHAETIEINEFPELAQRYGVQVVPLTVINDAAAIPGMVPEEQLVEQVTRAALESPAGQLGTATETPAEPIQRGKERSSGLFIP
jgi:glutaredoxin-like protein